MRPRLALPQVTLCCIDTRDPDLALPAMRRCTDAADFGDAVLFTRRERVTVETGAVRLVEADIDTIEAYSRFLLRGLGPHLRTSHVLVVQWDGYVLHPEHWDPAFLSYDYIGARWRDLPAELCVGNGGFSLRSRRLLDALMDPAVRLTHPEDLAICRDNRELLQSRHGIRFAPSDLAQRFSFERLDADRATFGFHGLFNFHLVMPADELHRFLQAMPDHLATGHDACDLCYSLIALGRFDSARLIVAKNWRQRRFNTRSRKLYRDWIVALASRHLRARASH